MNDIVQIKLKRKSLKPHKSAIDPILHSKNVLTNSPWDFVELWLKKNRQKEALFYWAQAREFHTASSGLPTQSAPLLHYYSFMNAAKALLASKSISFNPHHGVGAHNMRRESSKISITNEGVKIKSNGILPSLSTYLGETESSDTHSLQELLFNLPYIHRTYCLTYPSQTDMFIPINDPQFVVNRKTNEAYFRAILSKDYATSQVIKRLPSVIVKDTAQPDIFAIRSAISVPFTRPARPLKCEITELKALHKELRHVLHYINGSETLWYIKSEPAGPHRLNRFPLTITLAAMHRLSELSRYKPLELDSFLSSQKNWLLSEFIQQSPNQFFDEIASEITGYQFLVPNIRSTR